MIVLFLHIAVVCIVAVDTGDCSGGVVVKVEFVFISEKQCC